MRIQLVDDILPDTDRPIPSGRLRRPPRRRLRRTNGQQLFTYGLVGILIGLGAVGLYDLAKLLGKTPDATVVVERPVDLTFPSVTDTQQISDVLDGLPRPRE